MRASQAREVADDVLGREVDETVGRAHHLVGARHHRSHVDAVRLRFDLLERETIGNLAVAITPRSGAHLQVDDARRSSAVVLREDVGGIELLRSAERGEPRVVERLEVEVVVLAAGAEPAQASHDATFVGTIG